MGLIPRRGYLMMMTGIIIGMLIFSLISLIYSRRPAAATLDKIELEFLYSSEKQTWLEEVIPEFEREFSGKYGIDITVRLVPAGTHETVNLILSGSSRPVVWSPASSIWIPYLNKKWSEQNPGEEIAKEWRPLVLSPVVIAGWKSLVDRYSIKGFMDLYRLSKIGVSYKWGHPDPLLSNGGTMTVLLEFCEAAGKTPEELTVEDLTNETVMEIVREIESRAVKYGKSTGFFGSWAVDGGPDTISFFGVYESVVIDNALKARKKWNDAIVAVYPSFGTLLSDHPFVILDAPWVKWYQKLAAEELLRYLLRPDVQLKAQRHGFRPVNPSVSLNPSIFSEKNGVKPSITARVMGQPRGEVLEVLFRVWDKVKNPGV